MTKSQSINEEDILRTVNGGATTAPPIDLEAAFIASEEAKIKKSLQDDLEIDLEETSPLPVSVAFAEWHEEDLLDTEGKPVLDEKKQPRKRLIPEWRIASINTYVPVELFAKVTAMKDMMQKLSDNGNEKAVMDIYCKCVLEVWIMSEPDMTLKRLCLGLNFKKIRGLFARFFTNLTD